MIKSLSKILFIVVLTILSLAPYLIFANGGDQRIVEGKYYINFSRAPFTPRVGVKTSMLVSFVDLKTNNLVSEDLIVKVRISKLGGAPNGEFIFVQDNMRVKGGVLELSYTFTDFGLHEVFFDFALVSDPQRVYNAPDFLLDIQKPLNGYSVNQILMTAFGGLVMGFFAGWFMKRIVL